MVKIEDIKSRIDKKLDSALISSGILLSQMRLIEDSSRKTAAFQDPRYIPFYYYLGKELNASSIHRVIEVGVNLGLLSSSFFRGLDGVDEYIGFQQKQDQYYSSRLAKANLKGHFKGKLHLYVGNFTDDAWLSKLNEKENDIVFVNETVGYDELRYQLDCLWKSLALDGLLFFDGITKESNKSTFETFCKTVNREPIYFKTRYGTGVVQR